MELDAETTRSRYNIRAYVRLIIVISIVACIVLAIGVPLYKAYMKGEMLKKCLRDDTVIAEDTIDANLSSNIIIIDIIEKGSRNIQRREKLIERLRSLDGTAHKNAVNQSLKLLVAENEYLRAEKLALMNLAESIDANTISDVASQNYTEKLDRFLYSNPEIRYLYRDSYLTAREESKIAEQKARDKSNEYFTADDSRVEALQRWAKVEKDCQHVFDKYLPSRHLYIRLIEYTRTCEKQVKTRQNTLRKIDEITAKLKHK